MLFNATYAEELRVAAVEGQKLINFDIETSSKEQRRGNIYKGIVTRVEPSLEACFVDYGADKQGFLPFKEIDFRYLPEVGGQRGRDFTKLPEGTELIVQVEKDERGNKGAALTSYITLPGRYLVLMPNNARAGGISRRIEGEERDELKTLMTQLEVPQGMSVILRTAALGRVAEELQWDLTYLLKLWAAIRGAAMEQKGAFLIYQESSLVIRSIRDHFSPDISEVLIDTEEVYQQARQFMAHVMPNFADRIKLYRDDVPLFSRFQIEHQIESAYSRTVNLPSGGAIVIDHTEALTSVDVNSAKANKGADIETTAFLTNLEAAEEVARQLRLRDLGGLVVVDFIDMENTRNQRDLENHFKLQLGLDRARIQMGKLSKFGLLELSRQRLQSSLDESSTIACPRCAGVGSIRGIESSALHVLRIIQEEAVKNGSHLSALQVQLPVDVATYLLNERRDDVAKIEARMKVKIILIPNVHLDSPNYKIKKVGYDSYENNHNRSSYNLVEMPEENLGYKPASKRPEPSSRQPVVQNIPESSQPAPVIAPKSKSLFAGIIKKLGGLFQAKPAPRQISKPAPGQRKNQVIKNLKPREVENKQASNNDKVTQAVNAVRERSANSLGANKTRPVAVSKSNNKIQTVRPVQDTSSIKSAATYQPAPKPERNNQRKDGPQVREPIAANNKQVNNQQPNRKERKEISANAAIPKRVAPIVIPPVIVEDKINIADKKAAGRTIFAASASGAVVMTVITDVLKTQETKVKDEVKPSDNLQVSSSGITPNQTAIDSVSINLVETTLLAKSVELGNLQLVATKVELMNQPEPEIIVENVKRFSDIIVEERVIDPNIIYQQVETKS